ncbi:ABC transporter family substrate-binding protein [Thermoactinospora rubra]|uniref:ABC transporter family substrate-binding protein n=1 Tax=Thermoactinospora rubra TaxID=1088767 RepID=UPI001F0B44A8|nr:ABC transporter family substrate-binding protein [Thermoactinospora rubra]
MRRFLVIALAVAPLLAGCGLIPGGGGEAVKAHDLNVVARDRVREGGTLRWGIATFPTQWNANHVDGDSATVRTVVDALMPAPFRSDERGRVSPDADYVLREAVTAVHPRQTVTLRLNPEARWSDGTPITWEDYRAQWRAMTGPAYRASSTTGYQDIQSVARGRDEHEVVITFGRRFADWRSLFRPLYPRSANASPAAFATAWLDRIPVTAGPFKVESIDTLARIVTLVRDDAWWGDRARLDRIVYRAMGRQALAGAFAAGEIDVFDVAPSAADYVRVKAIPGAVVRRAAGPGFRHLTLNGRSPILSDPRVRRAVAMAVDRQAVAQAGLRGLDWPGTVPNNHFFMGVQHGYQDNAGALGVHDAAGAAALLEEAGWRAAGQTRRKDGKELVLRFVLPAGSPQAESEGTLLRHMLGRVGIGLTLHPVPSGDFFARHVIPGDYDLATFSYAATPFPVSGSYGVYAGAAGGRWHANLGRIGSPEIDMALRAAAAELDPELARDHANVADRLIWEAVNVIPLYQRPQLVAVRPALANIGARGLRDLRYQDIGFTG